ncbi:MAG: LptA/OstA family protein [Trueperaceae bacterium]
MRTRHTTRSVALAVVIGVAMAGYAAAQSPVILTVEREDATLVITNRGLSTAGARNLFNRRGCEEDGLISVLYGPPDEVEMVIDGETTLRSSLVVIREPESSEGAEEASNEQTIEMIDGQATFSDRPPCLESFSQAEEPLVLLEQGRTTVAATRFFLDRDIDVAQLDGPVELDRAPEGDSEALRATSESMTFDLNTQRSTLTGAVEVVSGDRVSRAETLELDEEAGLATLTGSPARSVQGQDEIEGETLLYYLDSNDVVVLGGVKGTLEVDLD